MDNKGSESKYRWYVLILAGLTLTFCLGTPNICMSVLFDEISSGLGLNLVQVGWIWGFYPMSGLFTIFILTMLGHSGCIQGMTGYLPIYLRDFKEWLPASADGTLAAFTGFNTLGALPISMLSDRIGRSKIFILPIITFAIIGVGLLSLADGVIIWVLIILVAIGRDGLIALGLTSCIESEGTGALYSGTAIGILHTINQIGGFISPPMGNSMATNGSGLPFRVWAAFALFALICYSLTRETGH